MNQSLPRQGFTLIEVMISVIIVGILSTIVVGIAVKSSRAKAETAKGLNFSGQIAHANGDELLGAWDFEETSGGIARDSSGNGNDGTIVGAEVVKSIPELGKALKFPTASTCVNVPASSTLNPKSSVTIEAWVFGNSPAPTGWRPVTHKNTTAGRAWWLGFYGESPGGSTPSSTTYYWSTGFMNLQGTFPFSLTSRWTHIAATYQNGGRPAFYANGKRYSNAGVVTGDLRDLSALVSIGCSSSGENLDAILDNVRIYSRAFTAFEIQRHYAEGLERHRALVRK